MAHYTTENLGKYRRELMDIGITDENDMVVVMNFLRDLAEIAVDAYYEKTSKGC